MQKKNGVKSWISCIFAALIVILTAWSVSDMFFYVGSGNMQVSRFVVFRYFTIDSNILSAAGALCLLIWRLCARHDAGRVLPLWLTLLRYAGTAAVTVTLMTVLCFLGPLYGYPGMFAGWNLYLHLIGPLLALAGFIFLDPDRPLERRQAAVSVLPVVIYGAVYVVQVVFRGTEKGGWPDFYGFNIGGRWLISVAAMLAGTLALGALIRYAQNRVHRDAQV